MQTVLITGGTGMIGKALTKQLSEKGYRVIVLSKKKGLERSNHGNGISFAHWDVPKQLIDITAIQKADFIIHLAGAGVVDKKWTNSYKNEIQKSRTESSRLLIETLKNHSNNVRAIISAS